MDEYGDEAVQSLHFFYDAQSRPVFVEYNGVKYRYLHNLQGDIVGIVDNNGNLVVEYKYDVWGKPISITGSMADTLGKYNPFRYRGYVYEEETELYYLRSRYYNMETFRFLNGDSIIIQGFFQLNLFCYCMNKPVSLIDNDGNHWLCVLLYLNALTGVKDKEYDFSKNEVMRDTFTKKISASTIVNKRINKYIKEMSKDVDVYEKTEEIYWPPRLSMNSADVDLAFAIGHTDFFTLIIEREKPDLLNTITFTKNKYKVTYSIYDKYDFEKWEGSPRSAAVIFINDKLGYDPQEAGDLKKYTFRVSGDFCVYSNF